MSETKTKVGKAAMFANKSDNPKAPKLRVVFDVNGAKHEIALWGATDDEGRPKLTRDGDKYWSGTVTALAPPADTPEPYNPGEYADTTTDDLPF